LGVGRRRADFELHSAAFSQHLPIQFEMFDFSRRPFAVETYLRLVKATLFW
jgi:hypothetical protein